MKMQTLPQRRSDRLTRTERSALMSRIRSKDTAPELTVRRMLHALGYRYVLHDCRLPGTPDVVFRSRRKVVLVHGCFWHGHHCGRGFKPLTNTEFWADKIAMNQARDRRVVRSLRKLGWGVMTVWECSVGPKRIDALRHRLTSFLNA
jgi:DNA mismatch endonuclease, patch repair protein